MKKFNKILCFCLALFTFAIPFMLAGCDMLGGQNEVSLKSGHYEVTTYSIDGIPQENYLGSMVKVENHVFTDWLGNVATYETDGNEITITWPGQSGQVLKGTITEDTIFIDHIVNGNNRYIIELNYTPDVNLRSGSYEVITYSINGVSQESSLGSMTSVGNNTFTDWLGNVATYEIKGNKITITWPGQSGQVLKGTITEDTISIDHIVNGNRYIIVCTRSNG